MPAEDVASRDGGSEGGESNEDGSSAHVEQVIKIVWSDRESKVKTDVKDEERLLQRELRGRR